MGDSLSYLIVSCLLLTDGNIKLLHGAMAIATACFTSVIVTEVPSNKGAKSKWTIHIVC